MKYVATETVNLLEALRLMAPDSSARTLRQWLKHGRILVDGKTQKKASTTLSAGQTVTIGKGPEQKIQGIPILYEDSDLVVINKPQGLLSVATDFDPVNNAHARLKRHYAKKRVYVVHRLDQETSGVMVFALTKEAMDGLKVQFADHSITRCYTAIVEGILEKKQGTWEAHLLEDDNYKVHVANKKGERAISHYEVVKEKGDFSALNVTLETGKKNQIRVHCSNAGHPVVGDEKYGSTQNPLKRLGLHARLLAFNHPATGKRMSFESPLPPAFLRYV